MISTTSKTNSVADSTPTPTSLLTRLSVRASVDIIDGISESDSTDSIDGTPSAFQLRHYSCSPMYLQSALLEENPGDDHDSSHSDSNNINNGIDDNDDINFNMNFDLISDSPKTKLKTTTKSENSCCLVFSFESPKSSTLKSEVPMAHATDCECRSCWSESNNIYFQQRFEARVFDWIAQNVPPMSNPDDKQEAYFNLKRTSISQHRRLSLFTQPTNSSILFGTNNGNNNSGKDSPFCGLGASSCSTIASSITSLDSMTMLGGGANQGGSTTSGTQLNSFTSQLMSTNTTLSKLGGADGVTSKLLKRRLSLAIDPTTPPLLPHTGGNSNAQQESDSEILLAISRPPQLQSSLKLTLSSTYHAISEEP